MSFLGKGLESLIPYKKPEDTSGGLDVAKDETVVSKDSLAKKTAQARTEFDDRLTPRRGDSIFSIEVDKVEPNPLQPRRELEKKALEELAHSIREHGVLQPILVVRRETETPAGITVQYQLIAGERRWRAAKLAGLLQIPAVIRRGMPDDRVKLELALIENVQREDLNPIDRARAFKKLSDEFGLIQREIAVRIGKSRENVANTMRLLALPEDMQTAIQEGRISEGHARAILMAGEDAAKQYQVYREIIAERLNVREAENRAHQVSGKPLLMRKRASQIQDPHIREWQKRLQDWFGTKVLVQKIGGKGKIVVEFYSEEELRAIFDKMVENSQENTRRSGAVSGISEV